MSQQRTSARRRVRPNPNGVQFPTFDWTENAIIGNDLRLTMYGAGPSLITNLDGWTLEGIPQVEQILHHAMPTAVAIDGADLVLTYAVAPIPGSTFYIAPNDMAFRDPFGAFMCSKLLELGSGPPAVTDAVCVAAVVAGTGVDLTLSGVGGQLYLTGLPNIGNTTTAESPQSMIIAGNNIHVEYLTPVSSGDMIDWVSAANNFLNPSLGGLASFTQVVA